MPHFYPHNDDIHMYVIKIMLYYLITRVTVLETLMIL